MDTSSEKLAERGKPIPTVPFDTDDIEHEIVSPTFRVRFDRNTDYRRSTAITTNRPFKEWPKVFPDPLNAQVIAERLSERCEHFVLTKGFRIQKS